jgi:hypothetical protein
MSEGETALIKQITGVLDPIATSMGVLFGVILDFLFRLFEAQISELPINTSVINIYYLVIFGILIFNIIKYLRKPKFSASIQEAINFIKISKKEANLTDEQVKLMYMALYKQILANVNLKDELEEEIQNLE